jgi:hypothetical protein
MPLPVTSTKNVSLPRARALLPGTQETTKHGSLALIEIKILPQATGDTPVSQISYLVCITPIFRTVMMVIKAIINPSAVPARTSLSPV